MTDEELGRVKTMRNYYGDGIAEYSDEDIVSAWREFMSAGNITSFPECLRQINASNRTAANRDDQKT